MECWRSWLKVIWANEKKVYRVHGGGGDRILCEQKGLIFSTLPSSCMSVSHAYIPWNGWLNHPHPEDFLQSTGNQLRPLHNIVRIFYIWLLSAVSSSSSSSTAWGLKHSWISVLSGNPCSETLWASMRMLFHPASWGNPQKTLTPLGQSFQQPLKAMDFGSSILLYLPHLYLYCTVSTMHGASTKFLDCFFFKEYYLCYPTATAGTDYYHDWTYFLQNYVSVGRAVLTYIFV